NERLGIKNRVIHQCSVRIELTLDGSRVERRRRVRAGDRFEQRASSRALGVAQGHIRTAARLRLQPNHLAEQVPRLIAIRNAEALSGECRALSLELANTVSKVAFGHVRVATRRV